MADPKTRRLIPLTLTLAAAALLAAPGFASAQSALDHPLRKGARTNSSRANFAAEAARRNALVTGNAPNGRSFRGNVGYRAPGSFTGGSATDGFFGRGQNGGTGLGASPGSDDLFKFQRDSYRSSLPSRGIRGVSALKYQMQLATGATPTGRIDLSPIIRRPSTPVDNSLLLSGQPSRIKNASIDASSGVSGSLRSTSKYLSDSFLGPSTLGVNGEQTPGQALTYTIATPLRGVSNVTEQPPAPAAKTDHPTPGSAAFEMLNQRESSAVSTYLEPLRATPSYSRILDELRDETRKPAGDESPAESPTEPAAQPGATPGAEPGPGADASAQIPGDDALQIPGDADSPALDRQLTSRLDRLRDAMAGADTKADDADQIRADVERTLAIITRANPVVSSLAPPVNKERDLFAEQMRAAQKNLKNGRWFDAEERFAGALVMRPDDPLAAAGRIHAELGAGLFLSASINVQNLLRSHPEFLAVRFDAALLPSAKRLVQITDRLRANARRTNPMGRKSGMLLAYLGHQLNDDGMIAEGFAAIDRVRAASGDDSADPFLDVLRQAWAPHPEK